MDLYRKLFCKSRNTVPVDDDLETVSEKRERWRSIYAIYFTMFLMSLGFSIILTGVWPYLDKLDGTAGKEFMGYVVAANPLGQMLFSPLVGWWGDKRGSIRLPLLSTLALFTFASGMYSVLEILPGDRKMYMVAARFLVGVSSANIAVARSYLSAATKFVERTHAVSMVSLAQVLGFVVGPGLQAAVTPLGEDGVHFVHLPINMYTMTGWINVIMGILNFALFLPWNFTEHKIAVREAMRNEGKQTEEETIKSIKPDNLAAWTLIWAFFVLVFNFVLLETLGTSLTMDQFAWSKKEALYYMGVLMSIGAFMSCITFVMIDPLCKRFNERKVMLWGGFLFMVIGRILCIPWGPDPAKIAYVEPLNNVTNASNGTEIVGCPSTQEWCLYTPRLTLTQFLIGYAFTTIGYPLGVTLIQTIFSKVLGPRPQGVWMGFMTGAGCASRVLGPVFVSVIYTRFGTYHTFGITGLTLIISMLWLQIVNKRLIPPKAAVVSDDKDKADAEIPLVHLKSNNAQELIDASRSNNSETRDKSLKGDEEDGMRLFCSQNDDASSTSKNGDGSGGEKRGSDRKQDVDRFGCYQTMMFAIISLPLFLSAGFTLAYVFTAGEVKYRCAIPECEDLSNTKFDVPWLSDSVPDVSEMPKCVRYVARNHSGACTNVTFSNATRKCDSWIYDPSESTVLSEWDLTCDTNRWKLTLVGTINNVGQFVGLIFAGYVSDRYGRRTILTLATFLSGISGLIHSFSVNYWMFLAFEFIDATVAAGIYSAGFILGMEMAGVKGRVLASTIICCMFAVGEMLLGLIAMWLRSWRLLLRMVYGPALLAILLPVLIPESVRWLLANGKHEKVESIYRKMARINGLQVSEDAIGAFKELNMVKTEKTEKMVVTEKKTPVMQILNSSVMLTRLLACSFCWLTNTFVYYGLSLNSVAFAGDKYVNFILVAVVEIPAYFLTWFLTDYVGRKVTLSSSFVLGGVFCLAIQFLPTGTWTFLPLVLYMGGKWCITMSFSTIYIYTAELFPTTMRHSLLGICSMTGRMGSILSPQTPLLAQIMPELPLILFGCMALSAGLLSLFFPETLGTKLPDTVWEAENIGKTEAKQELQDLPS